MAGDSTPKANLNADHSESDYAQRFEISERAQTTAVRAESEARAAIGDVLEDIATSHSHPRSPPQNLSVGPREGLEGSTGTTDASNDATRALLGLQRGEEEKHVAAPKRKRAKPAITLRPTASFGAYHDFMQNLVTRMGPRHFAAYEDSVFRHYVQFGPPGVDLPTFEHILSQWDKKSKKFVFTDRNDGEEIPCSFNLEWVMEHTWFSNEGLHVDHNRDRKNRIWSRFFDKPETGGSSSIAPPKGGPTRRNVEDLLLKLVLSSDRRDVKDFVLLQILYQLSMIWCPSSVSGVPRHLFKYVDSIEQVNNTAWGTYIFSETSDAIERALKGPEPGKTTLYLQGCTPLVCLWYYELTGIKKPALGCTVRPPLTNWVRLGHVAGSLRLATVVAKASKATIKLPQQHGQLQRIEGGFWGKEQGIEKEKRREREKRRIKGPAAVDAGRARGPIDLLHKKKRREEDDDIPIDALDIDEDAEQPNDAVEQMDWPQQVIYWKSIAAMNESLRRENENKFKGMIAADRVKISALSVKVAKLSAQNRRLREELSEARSGTLSVYKDKSPTGLVSSPLMEPQTCTDTPGTVGGIDVQYDGDVNKSLLFDEANKESEAPPTGRASPQPLFSDIHKESEDAPPGELPPPEASAVDKALEAEINEGEKVSPPAKELLTCTETGTQREGTGREITPAVEVPSAGDGETQTCIDTLREDTRMKIKQSENAPPPAEETSTNDEDAPIVFSKVLNKRKRVIGKSNQ
ncbi:uncharacterized protein LOC109835294 [Asparagus officinalis]|uniref:uncharacterized protein LOC109835294 n=1 Tax=Asparagus officinalis TaxID=4686 RepID=UPI00098DF29A|nr:uncharacterized protein LOC109835294 [Asparagus officinalis]